MHRARARCVAVGPACEDRLRHRRRRRGPVRGASARGALAAPRARGNGTGRGPARGGRARPVVSLGPQSSSQDLVGPADGVDGAPLAPRRGGPLGPRRVAHLRGPGHRPRRKARLGLDPASNWTTLKLGWSANEYHLWRAAALPAAVAAFGGRGRCVHSLAGYRVTTGKNGPNTVFRRASPLSGLAREPGLDKETAHDRVH